ncbi:hypothetical protein GYA19_04290 [Candidatus Beckwithbacteria bacterium]|nr:hypothetical protein [Candidatus Beckwithbacteria bacterium]
MPEEVIRHFNFQEMAGVISEGYLLSTVEFEVMLHLGLAYWQQLAQTGGNNAHFAEALASSYFKALYGGPIAKKEFCNTEAEYFYQKAETIKNPKAALLLKQKADNWRKMGKLLY